MEYKIWRMDIFDECALSFVMVYLADLLIHESMTNVSM